MKITFTIFGKPEPQGSTKGFAYFDKKAGQYRAAVTSDNSKLKPWRNELVKAAIQAVQEAGGELVMRDSPVLMQLKFYIARPQSKPKRITKPTTKPDLSKLIRAVEDSLTGSVFVDDAQICKIVADKDYGIPERAEIVIATGAEARELAEQVKSETLLLFA